MSIPLENARLCLDCDTIFEEARCPSCSSETFFPLSRWVKPTVAPETPPRTFRKTARNTSLVLVGSGVAYALWKLFMSPDRKDADKSDKK